MYRLAWPDQFIEHASSVDYLRQKHGLSVERLIEEVKARVPVARAAAGSQRAIG